MRPITRASSLLLLATAVCALGLVLVLVGAAAGTVVLAAVFALLCVLAPAFPVLPSAPAPAGATRCRPFPARAPPVS